MLDAALDVQTSDPELEFEEPTEAHVVPPWGGSVAEATVMGTPVQALCGKTFVPTRNPYRLPVCERCKALMAEYGDKEAR